MIDEHARSANTQAWTRWSDSSDAANANSIVTDTVYLWNVTNMPQVLNGSKPVLEQVGPYVFETYYKMLNVSFFNDTEGREVVQFKKWSWNVFDESASTSVHPFKTAHVCWPNEAMWALWASKVQEGFLFYEKKYNENDMTGILFHCDTPEHFIGGYIDTDIEKLPPANGAVPGVLANQTIDEALKLGFSQMFTGSDNTENAFQYKQFLGHDLLLCPKGKAPGDAGKLVNCWGDDSANILQGTDGSTFAPYHTLGNSQNTIRSTFVEDTMRVVPLQNIDGKTNTFKGIDLTRFELNIPVIMGNATTNPETIPYYAFDPITGYYPNGMWNLSSVQNAPIMISAPHFLSVDSRVADLVVGLTPNYEAHTTHLDVEPVTGLTMYARKRWQINMRVQPFNVSVPFPKKEMILFPKIDEWLVIPMCWIEEAGEVSDSDASQFREGVYFAKNLMLGIKFGGAGLGCILAFFAAFQYYTAIRNLENQPAKYKKINEGESDLTARLNQEAGY